MYSQPATDELFMHLVFGLHAYLKAQHLTIPNSLRHTLNAISFSSQTNFPRTFRQFIGICHQPVMDWYPFSIPDNFNGAQPLLYDDELSEEAEGYCLDVSDQLGLSVLSQGDIPQTALDNLNMVRLRERLKGEIDQIAAQQRYNVVRSFLISFPWVTLDKLREQPRAVMEDLSPFYEEVPYRHIDQLAVCDRCGMLELHGNQWRGIKPGFCADHGSGSPHVHMIRNVPQLYRLKLGVQLRTFIPGRIELALFTFAEELHYQFDNLLLPPERYPGLDTYDLRLSFTDGEIWAVDAKDHAHPEQLAKTIHLPYSEGDLAFDHCYYVIPDERMVENNYRSRLGNALGEHPANLHMASLSEFMNRVESKLKSLARPSKKRK
ncbi:MAG: hypothetical protein IT320_07960 [Anaerolineae bacterium]|nr:hypothetical protein [Anaerolineae bacterium]